MSKAKLAVLAGATFLAASSNAAIILIDSFTTTQSVQITGGSSPPTATATNGVATGVASLGGFRNITLSRTSGTGTDESRVNLGLAPNTDILEFSVAANDVANLLVLYDGGTDNVNSNGLGSVNLTPAGLNPRFEFLSRSDLAGSVTLTVYSGAGNASSASFSLPALGFGATPFTVSSLLFSSFSTISGSGANFGAVTALTIGLTGSSGLDAQLDILQARTDNDDNPVPEPATTALVGAGLTGLYLMRRRK